MKYLLKNGLAVTMDPNRNVFQGDLLIENDRIAAIGTHLVDSQVNRFGFTVHQMRSNSCDAIIFDQ
ncbi:MAG TPA: hypothetical protein DDZ70_04185, partial [Firmicutes bacterium]|nr:hypothetical protein [Bacillota bacterium]